MVNRKANTVETPFTGSGRNPVTSELGGVMILQQLKLETPRKEAEDTSIEDDHGSVWYFNIRERLADT